MAILTRSDPSRPPSAADAAQPGLGLGLALVNGGGARERPLRTSSDDVETGLTTGMCGVVRRCCGVGSADRRGGKNGVNAAAARQGALHQDFFRLPPLPCGAAPEGDASAMLCMLCLLRCCRAGDDVSAPPPALHPERKRGAAEAGGGDRCEQQAVGLVHFPRVCSCGDSLHHSRAIHILQNCCPFLHATRRHHHTEDVATS